MTDWKARIAAAREAGDPALLLAAVPYASFLGLSFQNIDGERLVRMPFADHLVGDSGIPALHGGTLGALICTPPYLIGRIGVLLLGSLFPLGVILLVVGLTLQAGATGAVKAIKMSAKLAAGKAASERSPAPARS